MSQNHLKICRVSRSWKYILRLPKLAYKSTFARRNSRGSIIHAHTYTIYKRFGWICGTIETVYVQVIEPISRHKPRVNEMVNLYSYLLEICAIFCAPRAKTAYCCQQKPPGWIRMVVTCQMTVTLTFWQEEVLWIRMEAK